MGSYAIDSLNFGLFLGPHLQQDGQVLVVGLGLLKVVEGLNEHLADVEVLGSSQEVLARLGEFGVEVSRKHGTGVFGKDAQQHNGIVLPGGARIVLLVQELSDQARAFCGGRGGRFGGFDNGGKEEDLIALSEWPLLA